MSETNDIRKQIKGYKNYIFTSTEAELKFIKVNRIIFLYIFTTLILALVIMASLIMLGVINTSKEINNAAVITFITGVFSQLITLMVIIFKYLFEPVKSLTHHTFSLIEEEKKANENSIASKGGKELGETKQTQEYEEEGKK